MFDKVLIANRGESAVRISRACRALGIKPIAVYVAADKGARYTQNPYASETYLLGDDPSLYTNTASILNAARETGADAIALGWGFLAENSDFVKLCEDAGIPTVSPTSKAIKLMGDKISAKRIAREANVPVIPGFEVGVSESPQEMYYAINQFGDEADIFDAATGIGYPVIVKGSAGGGGIGMKVAHNNEGLASSIGQSIRASEKSFNDGTVFVEKYLEHPRHIEVQVLGDKHGNIIHVGERECSIQRRHQKLIEECPSPLRKDNPEIIGKMHDFAKALAEKVGYNSAGTVEFLYKDGELYFLEMNTRLQVEHPITEVVYDVDLAKEQIRIAAGEGLGFSQGDIAKEPGRWAIECRINAETPTDFMPRTGKLTTYRSPGGTGIRVDSGVYTGTSITPHFDSMISKLIASGRTRGEAIIRMYDALTEYVIKGVTTNIPFHMAVMKSQAFSNGDLSTGFIEKHKIAPEVEKLLESNNGSVGNAPDCSEDTPESRQIEAAISGVIYAIQVTRGQVPKQFVVEVNKAQKTK